MKIKQTQINEKEWLFNKQQYTFYPPFIFRFLYLCFTINTVYASIYFTSIQKNVKKSFLTEKF